MHRTFSQPIELYTANSKALTNVNQRFWVLMDEPNTSQNTTNSISIFCEIGEGEFIL